MTIESPVPSNLIQRPDGSFVDPATLPPRQQIANDLVNEMFPVAEDESERLTRLKKRALNEMRAYRDMMLADHNVKVGGHEGGFSLRSIDGRRKIELSIAKSVSFGPELMVAKAKLDEFLALELEGSSEVIHTLIQDVFKINSKGRLDTAGILGLRKHPFRHSLWIEAMDLIDEAICRDHATTYVRFYNVDPEKKTETMIPLDLAKV